MNASSLRERWDRLPTLARKLVSLAVILAVAYLLAPIFWEPLDQRFYDFFQARWNVAPFRDAVVVGIDRPTRTELFEPPVYPLSRHARHHAGLVAALDRAGARAIVFDLSLSEDSFSEPPRLFAGAIRASGRVRLISYLEEQQNIGRHGGRSTLVQVRLPHPELLRASVGAFVADVQLDRDGTLRRMYPDPRFARLGIQSIQEHLSGATLRGPTPIVFPTMERPLPEVSYRDLINGDAQTFDRVRGRIAFIGQVDDVLTDFVAVPVPQALSGGNVNRGMPGVAVLAAMTETLLQGAPVRDAPPWAALLWNAGWCVIAIFAIPRRRPWSAALVLLAITVAAVVVTGLLHARAGFVLPCGLLFGCLFLTSAHSVIATHVETNRENIRVRKELDMARDTQLALLPQEIPTAPGLDVWGVNVSSLEVSGDYFDVIDSDSSNELVLVIADVCGKGLPAAIIMSNVHAALHSHMGRDSLDLASIAHDLNQLLCKHTPANKFVTFYMAAVEKTTRRMRYVSAGHDPPVHLRGSGEIGAPSVGGPPLGLFPETTYSAGEEQLVPGDVLCLYTDGVTDALADAVHDFGRGGVEETLRAVGAQSAKEISETIVARVRAFTRLEHQADDVTMVVLRVLES